jgi:hypothetical protein
MKEVKKAMIPVIKIIDQLDKEAVLGITGVMLLLTIMLGGMIDVLAMAIGVFLGIALYKKFF